MYVWIICRQGADDEIPAYCVNVKQTKLNMKSRDGHFHMDAFNGDNRFILRNRQGRTLS